MISKVFLFMIFAFFFLTDVDAQFIRKLGKTAENAAKRSVERRVEKEASKKTDETIDKVLGSNKNEKVQKNNQQFLAQSKFDFVPGEKVLFYDDFSAAAIGDFPARWNTNSSGEIVSLNGNNEKWLKVSDNSLSFPEINSVLPENFTVEFDLFYPANSRPPVTFGFTEVKNPARESIKNKEIFYFHIPPSVKENIGYSTSLYSGRETTTEWAVSKMSGKIIRISIAVNKQRIRLYVDDRKVFDLPQGFEPKSLRNNFHFRASPLIPAPIESFYISNLRIAETGLDVRSQLLNNGKFSTSGIYFATGSAKIQPQSHGVMKEIADMLNENTDVEITIIGHTDNMGNANSNQKLSEQRAETVKNYLNKTFAVENSRMETTGKGQSQPLANNSSAEGKAQNRRVEFVRK